MLLVRARLFALSKAETTATYKFKAELKSMLRAKRLCTRTACEWFDLEWIHSDVASVQTYIDCPNSDKQLIRQATIKV